jgi:hypothetical protein
VAARTERYVGVGIHSSAIIPAKSSAAAADASMDRGLGGLLRCSLCSRQESNLRHTV